MTKRGGPKRRPSASLKNESAASGKEHAASDALVLDFLYYDAARIGSFLAQVDAGGHLTGVTQGESISQGKKRGHTVKLGAQLPTIPGVTHEPIEGSLAYEMSPGDTGTESGQRTYDPFWTNARNFLDFLNEENLVTDNLKLAGMGQFVRQTGDLWLLDMKLVQSIVQEPSIQATILANVNLEISEEIARLAFTLIPMFDMGVQATVVSKDNISWGSLRPESISVSSGDLMIKHGAQISGKWTVLGVLDAKPDSEQAVSQSPFEGFAQFFVALGGIRPFIGRPAHAYGLTPLLIYREVSGG